MDLYFLLKFGHVMAAVAWVGAGLGFTILGTILERRGDMRMALSMVRMMAVLGPGFFMPASLLTLLSGLMLFFLGMLPWTGWPVMALLLVAAAFGLGVGVVKPAGEKIAALVADGQEGRAIYLTRRLLRVARFEAAIMMAIVALMVMQPTWADMAVLLPLALLVILAGFGLLIRPARVTA